MIETSLTLNVLLIGLVGVMWWKIYHEPAAEARRNKRCQAREWLRTAHLAPKAQDWGPRI